MNTAKIYFDSDGNECSIHQMVKREPHWAANRIQEGEKAIELNERLRHAAKLIAKRPHMVSGGLEMANCDAYCKELGLRPWDSEWLR